MHSTRASARLAALALAALVACTTREPPSADDAATSWTDPAPHRSGFVNANGTRLHYLDWGGTGPTLILIHGYGDNPHVFDDLAPAFTDAFRVVAYARRGHGRSGSNGPYDTATLTEDLRQLIDSLGIARAHLAGWSMGGNEVTMMAGLHPDRVDRIVYLDAAFDWADPMAVRGFDSLPIDLTPPPSALASLDAYRASYLANWFPGLGDQSRLDAFVRDLVTVQPDGSVRPAMSDSVAQAMFGTLVTDRRDYARVKAPALAIYAETFVDTRHGDSAQLAKNRAWEERIFAPFREASISRVRRELGQVEVLTVPGTHADFVFTSREQVVQAMRRFLGA